jgi:Putative bacterial sensory transduction regulator
VARLDVIRPFVEKAVAEYIGTKPDDLMVNEDGSIPIRRGSTAYYVRLMDGSPPMVQVYSTILYDVQKSPELFERLNEINAETMFARAFWTGDSVVVATEMVADSIDTEQLANACGVVGTVSDHFDDELRSSFGGRTIFNDESDGPAGEPPDPDDDRSAGYM